MASCIPQPFRAIQHKQPLHCTFLSLALFASIIAKGTVPTGQPGWLRRGCCPLALSSSVNTTHSRCRDFCPFPYVSTPLQQSHSSLIFQLGHQSSSSSLICLSCRRWKVLYNFSRGHLITLSSLIVPSSNPPPPPARGGMNQSRSNTADRPHRHERRELTNNLLKICVTKRSRFHFLTKRKKRVFLAFKEAKTRGGG